MTQFPVVDDCLEIGGASLVRLADRVGSTPFYAYDRKLISDRVALLRERFPKTIELHYAIKANPMPALLCHMSPLVDGLDVASSRELRAALDTGMPAKDISFAGPGKSEAELSQAVAAGILINVESHREIEVLARISAGVGYPARVAIRVNPDFELRSSGMKMGGGAKQFGVDAEAVPELLRHLTSSRVVFEGFHIYAGSQNLKAESICEAQRQSFALAARLAAGAPSPVKTLNLGGGFGIPYFPGEARLDLDPIAANLADLTAKATTTFPGAALVLELGRFLVGEAGIYVCRVVERKISRGQVFLITDGGLHHHLAASGNFGQVIRKNYPVVVGNRVRGSRREIASVVGPLCTPLDVLADQMDLVEAHPGDLIVIFQSGAYGFTASPTAFLNHPEPLQVLV
jgi:diaminopimelate decarboxylase